VARLTLLPESMKQGKGYWENEVSQPNSTPYGEVQFTGFWVRFLAFLIDSIAAMVLIVPVVVLLLGETRLEDYDLEDAVQATELMNRMAIQFSLETLLLGTIFVLFWTFRSATPGKMLVGCSIVDAKTYGKADSRQNVVRYIGYFVSLIPFGLGFLWIALDRKKQGWHDKMAGTLVIKGRPHEIENGTET